MKLTGNRADVTQADFHEMLFYNLQCLFYRTANQVQKKFQMEAVHNLIVRRSQQISENFAYGGKEKFAFCTTGHLQGQKKIARLSPETIRNHLQNCPRLHDPFTPSHFVDVINDWSTELVFIFIFTGSIMRT